MIKASIVAENLTIGYRNHIIANNINFTIKQPSLVALLGANGKGKSTLLKTITKQQPILSGNLLINQTPIHNISDTNFAKLISVLLTDKTTANHLSVYELVALGRSPYTNWLGVLKKSDRCLIDKAIEITGISKIANKRISQLSDGQLQKVQLARILAQDSPIILLDEPTSHLDLEHQLLFFELISNLVNKHHKTIIIVTHQLEWAIKNCDSFLVFTSKEFRFGTLDQMYNQNTFNHLFLTKTIRFDKITGRFINQ